MEKHGETIKMKGKTLEEFKYLQTQNVPNWAVRGEKEHQEWA
jgi:hypothetical protein